MSDSILSNYLSMEPWKEFALCAQIDPELFFDSSNTALAKAICQKCPVKEECYEYSFTFEAQHGVWGGETATKRKRIIKDKEDT